MNSYMKAYARIFSSAFKTRMQYRVDLLFDSLFNLMPVVAIIAVWHSIYDSHDIGGFSLSQIVTYTIVAKIIEQVVMPDIHWRISREIASADIIKYYTRPISYQMHWFVLHISEKVVSVIISILPLFILVFLYSQYFIMLSLKNILVFCFALLLSLILAYFFYYLISLLTFKFIEISSFFFTVEIVVELFSGTLIPLDLLPAGLTSILRILPFASIVDFPMSIYLNRLSEAQLYFGFITQIIWIIIFVFLSLLAWRIGTLKYEAPGV